MLGNNDRRVVGQHYAAGADTDAPRAGGDMRDDDRRRGTGNPRHVVVLGHPEAAVPPLFGMGGKVASPVHMPGGAANAALMLATAGLAAAYGASGIRVNGIAPGPVLWPETGLDAARRQQIVSRTLLQRAGSPADVARAVRFFATDAPYVTGQILAVDGGRSLRW